MPAEGELMTIQEAAAALRAHKVSSLELTSAALDRTARLDPKLKAFITVMDESARSRARQADAELSRGVDLGSLHGIPVAVKDVFSTRGVRTTCGSKLFADHVPDQDAAVVERLESAGAVLIGKTNMHELAYGITSSNPHFGAVRNPWDLQRIPGGSSGGSGAAVAADLVFMAMGSDTGGSIRIPASFCGTVGLKPTFGRVSRYGVLPLDFSLDHMGPLTRSVRDAALVLNALAGFDPRDETCSRQATQDYCPAVHVSVRNIRIGLPENFYFDQADPTVTAAVRQMAKTTQSLGAQVLPARVPDIAALNTVGRVILLSEASALMERYLHQRQDFGADVLALLDQGRLLPATHYVNAQRLRRAMKEEFQSLWKQVDCIFVPTTPTSAPKIGQATIRFGDREEDARLASTRLVRGINVLGLPALSMPCGWDSLGLPLGLQIIGAPFQEALILRVGAALEDAIGVTQRVPTGIA
jgi:aspartyl-tRNA(Asn)/glutamyl-tRNA(Gln) amidotransferase subunit A